MHMQYANEVHVYMSMTCIRMYVYVCTYVLELIWRSYVRVYSTCSCKTSHYIAPRKANCWSQGFMAGVGTLPQVGHDSGARQAEFHNITYASSV